MILALPSWFLLAGSPPVRRKYICPHDTQFRFLPPFDPRVGARPALDVYEDERTTLSFFAKYRLNKRTMLNLDVNNITDSPKRGYQGDPSNPRSVRYYDWAVNFRVSYSL